MTVVFLVWQVPCWGNAVHEESVLGTLSEANVTGKATSGKGKRHLDGIIRWKKLFRVHTKGVLQQHAS